MDYDVLLIDDDRALCGMLTEYLGEHGYAVTTVQRGDSGLQAALQRRWALVLVDVMLPGLDGFEVVRRLRAASAVPILLLTARGDEVDRIVGLELGADDYLPKPFNVRELVARMRAILRRHRAPEAISPADVQVGKLCLVAQERKVTYEGQELSLTDVEYRILESLMRNPGSPQSRDHLAQNAHGRHLRPFDRSLDMHVSRLRRKLENAGMPSEALRTVRGEGYLLVGHAAEASR